MGFTADQLQRAQATRHKAARRQIIAGEELRSVT